MHTGNEFSCQWGSCSSSFPLESELYTHLKAHTKMARKLPCNWKGCASNTIYTTVGYLNDHVLSHLSSSFLSVWCVGCRAGFRNRQCLSRHQKKTGCKGSCRDGPTHFDEFKRCNECGCRSFSIHANNRCIFCESLKYK
jgi:hypothetical protein